MKENPALFAMLCMTVLGLGCIAAFCFTAKLTPGEITGVVSTALTGIAGVCTQVIKSLPQTDARGAQNVTVENPPTPAVKLPGVDR